MKAKTVISAILLAFIVASVAYLIFDDVQQNKTVTDASPEAALPSPLAESPGVAPPSAEAPVEPAAEPLAATPAERQPVDRVIAYYFHGTKRCRTCMTIEAYAEEALKLNFPERLGNGTLEWRVINVEQPEHEHFVHDFQLTTRSVVLVDETNEERIRWKNLNRVWELVGDEEAFFSYIAEETRSFFGEHNG